MAIATGTAIALAGAASAGAGIYGAHKAAGAAGKASEQQQQAATEAMRYQEPLYARALQIAEQQAQQGQARFEPYAQAGAGGIGALSSFLGVPAAAPAVAPPPMAAAVPMAAPGWGPPQAAGIPITAGGTMPIATTQRRVKEREAAITAGGRGARAETPIATSSRRVQERQAAMMPLAQFAGGPLSTGSSYVTLRAPTGQTSSVPADQVSFYLARGATPVR